MRERRVYLETFGCQMNELDSELVRGQLEGLGYRFTGEIEGADVVLYNTCSVREHAEQKVWSRLGEDKFRKAKNPGMVVGVLGCMAERDGAGLMKRMPVVDVMCGPGELDKLPVLLDNAVRTNASLLDASGGEEGVRAARAGDDGGVHKAARSLRSAGQSALAGSTSRRSATLSAAGDSLEMLDLSRAVGAGEHRGSAYVRITRGCNKFCTYCVVPFTRGAEVHRPPEHIIDECKKLADSGVVEVTLLGQTVNHYRFEHGAAVTVGGVVQPQKGRSYKGGHRRDPFAGERVTTFAGLLARIHDEVPGIRRLRFVTSYPRDFGDDALEVMRDHPRICRYLHVPAQSGSDRILKMMNRGYTVGEYTEFVDRARAIVDEPGKGRALTIAGDIIVGFPTETDEDFRATVELVEKVRYKNCFIFKYSPRPGTVAHEKIPDDVPDAVKRARNNELLAVQGRIGEEVGKEFVGREVDVFFEGLSVREAKRARAAAGVGGGVGGSVGLTVGGREVGAQAGGNGIEQYGDAGESASGEAVEARGVGEGDVVQVRGRTDGDLIVHVDGVARGDAERITGTIRRVRVTDAEKLALRGELV